MTGFPTVSNIFGKKGPSYRPVPAQEAAMELDSLAAGATPHASSAPLTTSPVVHPPMLPTPRLPGFPSNVRDIESLQPVRHRVGMSSSLTYTGLVVGALLGTTGATAIAVNAYLNLKSSDPVHPFNPHGGNHAQQADALLATTASLLIPIAGGIAGAAIGAISASIIGCCCY